MEKILNSAMADEEMNKAITRKNEIVDLVEQRKAEFEEADTDKRDEILNEVEELTKEGEELDENIAELEETRNTYKKQEERMSMTNTLSKSAIEERKDQIVEDPTNSAEYTALYADYIRGKADKRDVLSFLQSRSLTTSTPVVPQIMQGFVETAWIEYGKFSRLVAETFEAGIFAIPVEVTADGANWHDEGDEAPVEEEITFGQILLAPKMIKKWISLTDELMAMAPAEFLRYIADELVYRVVLALDEAIINRTDLNGEGVIGIAGNTLTETVSSALSFNSINEAVANLVTFDNLTIAMNPATFFGNVMGLTDQVGRPIYSIAQDNEGRPAYYLNGYRVEFTQALKAYDNASANDVWAIVGDFRRGYRLNYPQGRNVITLVDPYTLATEDVVRMIGRLYVAGNVVRPLHFAELTVPASV